jgi:hypothetical protein
LPTEKKKISHGDTEDTEGTEKKREDNGKEKK